jgi:hypothetical protein
LRPSEPTSYQFSVNHQLSQIFHEDENLSRAFPANTLTRSSGDFRSRSTSELLLMQKTKLPCLSTVCIRNTRHLSLIPTCAQHDKYLQGKTVSRSEHPRTLGLNLQPGTRLTFCGWPLRPAHLRWTGPRLDHFSLFEARWRVRRLSGSESYQGKSPGGVSERNGFANHIVLKALWNNDLFGPNSKLITQHLQLN